MSKSHRIRLPDGLFKATVRPELKAEKAMFAATGGVNTHKGIIFSMGLAAASAGFLFCSLLSDDASELSGKNAAR